MSITRHIDAHDHIRNFERAYLGPGVYVLYDGRVCDRNIVYIGKSRADVLMRVSTQRATKDFDNVGVVLPRTTNDAFIHNLEHYVLAEYFDTFGTLPHFNRNNAHFHDAGRAFDWHNAARRHVASIFVGDDEPRRPTSVSPAPSVQTVGEVRALMTRLEERHPDAPQTKLWTLAARELGGTYAPLTLRQYCSGAGLHGNTILARLAS